MTIKNNIQIYKQDWWATPIWFFDLDDNLNLNNIQKECYKEKKIDESGRSISNKNGWQSNLLAYNKYDEISKVLKIIDLNSHIFVKEFGVRDNYKFSIAEYWININNKGGYNIAHIHPQSLFSCIIYIKVPKNSGDVLFYQNQISQIGMGGYIKHNNAYNFESIKYEAIEKRVIIFPSYVAHSVEENKSDEDRISIAFNFMCK
jgi:uncharacterized protein (TIGR02466 family)